jgi:hypothetical protein
MGVTKTFKQTRVKGALVPAITRVPSTEPVEEVYKTIFLPSVPGNMGNIAQKGPGAVFLSLEDLTLDQLDNFTIGDLDLLQL